MSLPETEIDDLPKEIKALPEEMKAQYRSWAGYVLPDGRKFQEGTSNNPFLWGVIRIRPVIWVSFQKRGC
jgi:hypothetical protein